jgi:uncharacterized protein (TIGR01244 family)
VADDTQTIHINIDKLETSDDLKPVDGITSAGQPDAEQLALFAKAGYVAVIDLRGIEENRGLDEADAVSKLDMLYVNLPLASADAVNFENAVKLDETLNGIDGPVLLHCGSGNRVGALLALRESLNGASDEDALSYGRAAGLTRLEDVVRERLAEKK